MTALLDIENLSVALGGRRDNRLLRSVSLSVSPGEVMGLVGESGAGKSMIGKTIFGILPRAAEVIEGDVRFDGKSLLTLTQNERRMVRGKHMALIPQDPLTALNPSRRIGSQMTDRLTKILGERRDAANRRARTLLEEVHIRDPDRVLRAYPHELSGGMRQRVLIAEAFAAEPQLIVADEPTTALDVTVQKRILGLIAEMQSRHGAALLFVTHDLGVVAKICQTVTVLYSGMVVEQRKTADLIAAPESPYTHALLDASPRYDRPADALRPVSPEVLATMRAAVANADEAYR
ncbi:MAG: ABC transporter ATP-binding protein [Pseudomonadota bacterium]